MSSKAMIVTVALAMALALSLTGTTLQAEDSDIQMGITLEDGLVMYGWLTRSPVTEHPAPLWILVHQRGEDHTSWEGLVDEINRRFLNKRAKPVNQPHILTVDLRGHGRSTQIGNFSVSHENMRNEHFQRMPSDVAQMLKAVFAKAEELDLRIDTANTVLIGASIGANAAVMATAELDSLPVRAVATLSPGEEYAGMLPIDAMQQYQGDMLILVSTEDLLASASADYFEKKVEHVQVVRYSAYAHGTGILTSHPESVERLLDWLLSPERYQPKPAAPAPAADSVGTDH